MNIFDGFISRAETALAQYGSSEMLAVLKHQKAAIDDDGAWPLEEKAPFIMERDTFAELGGYPKESINLMLSSLSLELDKDEVHIIGDKDILDGGGHVSFGKILMLKTRPVADEDVYDYTQQLQMAEVKFHLKGVMQRSSGERFFTNLRISKSAAEEGFSLEKYGRALCEHFKKIEAVEWVKVILLAGDSPIYKQLLPIAEDIKKVTVALNTIFDGIDMDCGSCNLSEICDEVEGLRKLHSQRLP